MRFKQYLTELFDEKRDFEIQDESKENFEAVFKVDDKKFEFSAGYFSNEDRGEVFFTAAVEGNKDPMNVTKEMGEKAIEVYSYVISLTKYFLKEYEPERVYFEGYSGAQTKIYRKLLKKLEREVERMGYEIEMDPQIDGFYLEKE